MSDIAYLTAEIVASAAANEHSRMRPEDLVNLIKSVRGALGEDASASSNPTPEAAPAMTKNQWSKLITPGGITSLWDGPPRLRDHPLAQIFAGPTAQACHGVLRDVGKLIISLQTADLCKLLEERDGGTQPTEGM